MINHFNLIMKLVDNVIQRTCKKNDYLSVLRERLIHKIIAKSLIY